MPSRPGRCRRAWSKSKTRRATSPLEAIAITTTRFGLQPQHLDPVDRRRQAGAGAVAIATRSVTRASAVVVSRIASSTSRRSRESSSSARGGRRRAAGQQQVDVAAVAGVGRHPPRRGVGMGQEALCLQRRQLGPHRRRPPLHLRPLSDLFRRHRLRRSQVRVDHQPQNQFLPLGKHAPKSRRSAGWGSQTLKRGSCRAFGDPPGAPTARLRPRRS